MKKPIIYRIIVFINSMILVCCGELYIKYNSKNIYDTPRMNYKLEQKNNLLYFRVKNNSIGEIIISEVHLTFIDDGVNVKKFNYTTFPIKDKNEESFIIKIPENTDEVLVHYKEYDHVNRGKSINRFYRNDHTYIDFGTFHFFPDINIENATKTIH